MHMVSVLITCGYVIMQLLHNLLHSTQCCGQMGRYVYIIMISRQSHGFSYNYHSCNYFACCSCNYSQIALKHLCDYLYQMCIIICNVLKYHTYWTFFTLKECNTNLISQCKPSNYVLMSGWNLFRCTSVWIQYSRSRHRPGNKVI